VIYLTGGGLTEKTLPVLTKHPMIGCLSQPESLVLSKVQQFKTWAADNGCFTKGDRFQLPEYLDWLDAMAPAADRCLFATAPDVVADAKATWERSEPAIPEIRLRGYDAALVAQDGMESMDVAWDAFDALFIGGSTDWKLSWAARDVTAEAKRRGKWVHMGRVNSLRRLEVAEMMGCDSVDGNFLCFGPDKNLPRLLAWLDALERSPMLGWTKSSC
jgi:hypothetical protein